MGSVRRRDAGANRRVAWAEPTAVWTPWLLAVADASAMQEGGSRDPPAASCINPKRSIPSCAGTARAGVPSHGTHSTAMELPIALQFGASAVRSEADCNVGGHVGLPFVWRRAIALAGALKGRRKAPKAPGAFGSGGKKNHPWADWQARSSLEPSAHPAITPGPCRGWGRHRLAHIRAQREPVFAPAGTGTEYR